MGNILSSVLKKRNCISRTAPRLLCTLEPGEWASPILGSGKEDPCNLGLSLHCTGNRMMGFWVVIYCRYKRLEWTDGPCVALIGWKVSAVRSVHSIIVVSDGRVTSPGPAGIRAG